MCEETGLFLGIYKKVQIQEPPPSQFRNSFGIDFVFIAWPSLFVLKKILVLRSHYFRGNARAEAYCDLGVFKMFRGVAQSG